MAQRQWRSDDTTKWEYGFYKGLLGDIIVSSSATANPANAGIATVSAGASQITLDSASTFVNGMAVVIHQTRGTGAGTEELSVVTAGGGTTTLTLDKPLSNSYTDSGTSQAQVVEMMSYKNLTINSGVTLSAPAWDGNKGGILSLIVSNTLSVAGTINAAGCGFRSGYSTTQGEGYTTDYRSVVGNQPTDNAGGSVSNSIDQAGGGGGGHANNGGNDGLNRAKGGYSCGNAALTSSFFGGGGGGWYTGGTYGKGANGGGGLFIFAKNIIVTGGINISGNTCNSYDKDGYWGGGGGAAGFGLFKFVNANFGSGLIVGNGGSYGGWGGGHGGAGSVGRFHADYSGSYTGTTSPTLDTTLDPTIKAKAGGGLLYSQFL